MSIRNRYSGLPGAVAAVMLAVAGALWLVVDWAGPDTASGAAGSGQCPSLQSRDYSAPMRGFPPIRSVPQPGRFPFGPPRMALPSLTAPIQPGGGELGFVVDLLRTPPLQRRLNWQIGLRVSRLSARGVEREMIARRRVSLSYSQETGLEQAMLSAGVPGKPGFYRLDISIENPRGATLGRYSEYVRVVAPTIDLRLILGRKRFHPGEAVIGRIRNRGTVEVLYVLGTRTLEAHSPAGWRNVPMEPKWSGAASGVFIPAGAVSSCTGLRLPSTLAPGKYRLSLKVRAGRALPLRAVFHVG